MRYGQGRLWAVRMLDRRAALSGLMLFALDLFAPSVAATNFDDLNVSDSYNSRLLSILRKAQRFGLDNEAAAPGIQDIQASMTKLAEIISKSTAAGDAGDEHSADLADEAGEFLSELNRSFRGETYETSEAEAAPSFTSLKPEYREMFDDCVIHSHHQNELIRIARRIVAPDAIRRYKQVERSTSVPWFVVGALHYREASLNFMGHLHNGDFLKLKTVQVPSGRPAGKWPPEPWNAEAAWQLSAQDALRGFKRVSKWTVERMLYTFEAYNGWGYRSHQGFRSPYLWNYTQFYNGGGYPCDRCWSPTYLSKQAGLVCIIKSIKAINPEEVIIEYES